MTQFTWQLMASTTDRWWCKWINDREFSCICPDSFFIRSLL